MSEQKSAPVGMGDMIGATRQRLDGKPDPASRLQELVAATPKPKPAVKPYPETSRGEPPANYFHQVVEAPIVTPKRSPKKGPTRSQHVTMRLSAPERERLVHWCDERNLSLADGVMALLDRASGQDGAS